LSRPPAATVVASMENATLASGWGLAADFADREQFFRDSHLAVLGSHDDRFAIRA
jgi:hypothetical protein